MSIFSRFLHSKIPTVSFPDVGTYRKEKHMSPKYYKIQKNWGIKEQLFPQWMSNLFKICLSLDANQELLLYWDNFWLLYSSEVVLVVFWTGLVQIQYKIQANCPQWIFHQIYNVFHLNVFIPDRLLSPSTSLSIPRWSELNQPCREEP